MIKKYKKGDEVIVKVGKDKGKIGTISKVINTSDKVVISGINIAKNTKKLLKILKVVSLTKKCQYIFLMS